MFGATTNYPFNFANRNGIPMIESTCVNVTAENVVIGIPRRAFRFLSTNGIMIFRLNTEIPSTAGTLPILFESNDFTQPLTVVGGAAATASEMSGTGIYLIYYDKNSNILQLLNPTTA